MDNSQGARKRRDGVSEHTSDLLSEQQTPTVVDTVRANRAAGGIAWRSRPENGGDPEPTEEIFGDGDTPAEPPPPPPARKTPAPRGRLEPTHPVGAQPEVGGVASDLPDISGILDDEPAPPLDAPPADVDQCVLAKDSLLAGRYVILDDIEDSGMGRVYKALDRQRERAGSSQPLVALKIARRSSESGGDTAGHLRREFLKLSELRHPNIVAVYDFGSSDGVDFMVMEWLQGETLASLLAGLNSRRMALSTAEEIIRSVAAALAHAHAAGIVHGDVKPANVFVTCDHVVKLLDFGASTRSVPDANDSDPHGWATRAYASCEVLQGKPPCPADDVFALGVTAYRLLSGERPFGELDALEARSRGLALPELPPDAFASRPAVRNALQYEAMDRPLNAAEFLQQLDDESDDGEGAAFPRPVPAHLTAIAWGLLAALVLGGSAWWSIGDAPSTAPHLESLLARAAAASEAGRLLEPEADSAFTHYSEVLESDPDNVTANEGLDRVAEHYLDRARTSLAAEDFGDAVESLELARQVRPGHFGIAPIEDLIGRYRRDLLVSARQSADVDPRQAARYLAQATALSAEGDPQIAAVEAELERAKTAAEVDALVRAVDERILSERLLVPSGDSAIDLLRSAARIAPDDRQVQLARDRIASALLFQAMFSISNGNLGDAESFIDAVKSLGVRHLALARAEYELAKAQSDALEAPSADSNR